MNFLNYRIYLRQLLSEVVTMHIARSSEIQESRTEDRVNQVKFPVTSVSSLRTSV